MFKVKDVQVHFLSCWSHYVQEGWLLEINLYGGQHVMVMLDGASLGNLIAEQKSVDTYLGCASCLLTSFFSETWSVSDPGCLVPGKKLGRCQAV